MISVNQFLKIWIFLDRIHTLTNFLPVLQGNLESDCLLTSCTQDLGWVGVESDIGATEKIRQLNLLVTRWDTLTGSGASDSYFIVGHQWPFCATQAFFFYLGKMSPYVFLHHCWVGALPSHKRALLGYCHQWQFRIKINSYKNIRKISISLQLTIALQFSFSLVVCYLAPPSSTVAF